MNYITSVLQQACDKTGNAKRKYTDIEILIEGTKYEPDNFPLPVDWAKNHFSRYSSDTFKVDWNKNFQGQLLPKHPVKRTTILLLTDAAQLKAE